MGSFRLIEAECYIRNIADNGNPDQECHQAPVFFDFIFLFQQFLPASYCELQGIDRALTNT